MTRSHRVAVGPLGLLIPVGLTVGSAQAQLGLGGAPLTRIGLVDTGAVQTAISQAVEQELRPTLIGSTTMKRPGLSAAEAQICSVRLNFEGHLIRNPWFDLDVVVANPASPGIDVLIGMDVLARVVLFFEGVQGTMILSY